MAKIDFPSVTDPVYAAKVSTLRSDLTNIARQIEQSADFGTEVLAHLSALLASHLPESAIVSDGDEITTTGDATSVVLSVTAGVVGGVASA
jgi:cell shape-determining protein MreC